MSQFCIYIYLEDYIADWFIHLHGGNNPVKLIRNSVESKILEGFIEKRPVDELPDNDKEGKVAIQIPTFRNRPPDTYNYLPQHAKIHLINTIKHNFDVQVWWDLHRFGHINKEQKDLVIAWMKKNGIRDGNSSWDTIVKRYQRQRKVYLTKERVKKHRNRKKSS